MNLVKAAAANDVHSAKLLLENGADASSRYPGWSSWATPSPLFAATERRGPTLPRDVIDLVQYDAAPLHVAVLGGHYECVRLFVEAGADILGKDGRGR